MIDDLALEAYAERTAKRFEKLNTKVLKNIGEHIAEIKAMDSDDLHRLSQMYRFGGDVNEIMAELAKETQLAEAELREMIRDAAENSYADASMFYKATGRTQIPFAENLPLQQYIKSIQDMTAGTFMNYSNTSVIGFRRLGLDGQVLYQGISETYQEVISQAVTEITTGVTDFDSAMRSVLRELGDSGIRVVDYESGYSRRLDSSVRQNILDTNRKIYQGVQQQVGKEFGADGVELSAHGGCAADHVDIQGRRFTHAEYEELQGELVRPIGELNCKHFAHEIIMGISRPAYSEEQLDELKRLSNEKLEFEGREYTRYEATQLQRKLETAMRKSKDVVDIATAAGDDILRRNAQAKMNVLRYKYREVNSTFGLPYKGERIDFFKEYGKKH